MCRLSIKTVKRIVIKVGTSSLILPNGKVNLRTIDQLAFTLASLQNQNYDVILVTSGAIGVGLNQLGLNKRPATISKQQAVAAIGQTELIKIYSQRFRYDDQISAQVLLTRDVVDFPESRNNVINTINELLEIGAIPIINENDSVAVDELDHTTKFGDNDQLSAIVADLIAADLLIMLSDIDGFYLDNPHTNQDAKLYSRITEITPELENAAGGRGSRFGTGGMSSKIKAAHRIFSRDSQMVLANGEDPSIIFSILEGQLVGTLFASETFGKRRILMSKSLTVLGKNAKEAARFLANAETKEKNAALNAIIHQLEQDETLILEANHRDVLAAKDNQVIDTMVDRLILTKERLSAIRKDIATIVGLEDPTGLVDNMWTNEDGLLIGKHRVPIGVIGIIYEARPNVTSDAATLCFKSGNAVILRGGKEAFHSNKAIVDSMQKALTSVGFPPFAIQLVEDTSREVAKAFMQLNEYLDCLIPRGGANLIKTVLNTATVPVIETGTGNCHVYVDQDADLNMAASIIVNGKCQRPSVCNATETVIIHKAIASTFLPLLEKELAPFKVELRVDKEAATYLERSIEATEIDFATEFNDYILAIKTVASLEEAIQHIQQFTTHHSEVIVTDSYSRSQTFLKQVDAAAVYVNASSRFTDGSAFGFGGEIGISTQKIHARGPMGLMELTSYKYIIYGNGQIRK